MTQYLSSSSGAGGGSGAGGDSRSPPGSLASTPRRHCKSVGRGNSGARDGRNQCITDFFKPALNQGKKNGKVGLPVLCTEHLRKNISSPRQNRRKKLPFLPSNRSPIIEAFFRGAKSEKKDSTDNGVYMTAKAMHPKAVARQLFITDGSSDCSFMDGRDLLRKRSSSTSWESSSAESSKAAFSSGWDSDKIINMRKSQSYPSVYPNSITLLGIPKHKECAGKRKRISLKSDMNNLQKSSFSNSLENHNSECSKDGMSLGSDMQVEGMNVCENDLPISIEENGCNCTTNKDDQIQIAAAEGSQLQTFPHFYVEKLLPLSQEIGMKASSNESITSQENLFSKQSKESESHIQHNSSFEALRMNIHTEHPPLVSALPSKNNSETLVLLEDIVLSSGGCDPVTIPGSSCNLNEGTNLKVYMLNRKLYDGEDETSDCNLDSSDEEVLVPLEKILAQSARSTAESPEQRNDECSTTDNMIPSKNVPLSTSSVGKVSYMNHLEHLLKEKEELRRIDELEQELQHVKQGAEINCQYEEESNDGELSAEHRAFLERFSVISDAIPDQHPGENIFQVAHAGKIFSQHNLDLRNSGFHPQNPIEKYLLGSGVTQQLFVIIEGLLMSAYHSSSCPVPILKWMFQMMSIHPDSSVSRKILDMLMTLTIKNASASNGQPKPWIPSLLDIATVLINMGVPFSALFPLRHFQPTFSEDDIMSEMCETTRKQPSGDILGTTIPFFFLIDTNLCSMTKFLRLCISIYPEGYTDKEIFLLLLLLFKLSLEKELKQFPLVDLECLIIKLLENIREWETKMPELCLAISCLSSHHHDLLWLVQFVPNWITRGRQVRRQLSLVVISKLLKNHVNVPNSPDQQMSLLCNDLVKMKPSNLLKRISETVKRQDGLSNESFLSEFEPQAYYLTYVLLHLVREASNFEVASSNQRKWLLKLCSALEKHVKCDIREDARLFYKTKVKDLVARTYSKWQQMIHSSQLTQGQIHDFWVPDS
ncbi:SMC5-SMC6 complex localization factor protein 2 isoform X2 [Rhineura floridana]|uniref:SMC5-SMC6 complex localization factor protein 2 isoform X2 n=1 Tax=Rhineura floridana TaxID=261503 RepID=UPI002AC848A9|nr:SMC5-SMC6 complex localization factor protein 2 isoform X2 [Rhineura floridana]